MKRQIAELSSKIKTLNFRRTKTSEILEKQDLQASEPKKQSIINISKAVNELKETIEEKKFAKGADEGAIAEWSKLYESELEKADQDIKLLDQQIKKMDDDEREAKTAYEHERKLAFELELFERKAKFQEELEKTKQDLIWRHVPTSDNPADRASRAGDLSDAELWWRGPNWLKDPERWPDEIVPQPTVESNAEAKLVKSVLGVAVNDGNEADEVLKKFPVQKALRVCAWMRRFANNALHKRGRSLVIGPLTTSELARQRQFYIKRAQENCDLEKIWSNEYLRSLRERHRTKKTKRGFTPKVEDVVIISDDEKKRGQWSLGVVEELVAGKDGEVRVAKVRSKKSHLERAV
ncbi:Hypothetical predicted protein [Paramuricea clavata]|uniref:Uncharacterized protein n=1 Tax=Paramuricea clavata TaxID=317549 RepID=A0A7D9HQF4_PARCT|nr:Hypothetical predicted protein [Paramuricea clavata]